MIELIHDSIPNKLKIRKSKGIPSKPKKAWTNFARGGGKKEVKDKLKPLQCGLCIYCEQKLEKYGFHIEHILSKTKNPSLTFEYTNLSLSCMTELDKLEKNYGITKEDRSCGHSLLKSNNEYIEILFIKPTEKQCNMLFSYISNGKITHNIICTDFNKLRVNHTIKVLNLDCLRLERERREILESLYEILGSLEDKDILNSFITLELDKETAFFSAKQEACNFFQI